MKKLFCCVTVLAMVISICGSCSKDKNGTAYPVTAEDQIKIYYVNASGDSLQWVTAAIGNTGLNEQIGECLKLLKSNPDRNGYRSAIPEQVKVFSYEIGEDNQLVIGFSGEYNEMDRITEILCRACVVKTLCQLDGIDFIEFNISGRPLFIKNFPVGFMSDGDFTGVYDDGSGMERLVEVTLYYAGRDGRSLEDYTVKIETDGSKRMEEIVLWKLIEGPDSDMTDMKVTLNSGTSVNRIYTSDGICYVDFNEEFLSRPSDISDEVMVYSVVNTLCELQNITKVKLTVNGNEKKNIGKVETDRYLSFRPEL